MFAGRVTILVRGGDGGAGCRSFRREKYVPKAGPDGGRQGSDDSGTMKGNCAPNLLTSAVSAVTSLQFSRSARAM